MCQVSAGAGGKDKDGEYGPEYFCDDDFARVDRHCCEAKQVRGGGTDLGYEYDGGGEVGRRGYAELGKVREGHKGEWARHFAVGHLCLFEKEVYQALGAHEHFKCF